MKVVIVWNTEGEDTDSKDLGRITWKTVAECMYFSIQTALNPNIWFWDWFKEKGWIQLEKYSVYYRREEDKLAYVVHRCDDWNSGVQSGEYNRVFYFGKVEAQKGTPLMECKLCKWTMPEDQSMLLTLQKIGGSNAS